MDFGRVMDLLLMGCGVYMTYGALQMKRTNKIPEMLVGKGFPLTQAKDIEGFVKATFPITLIFGVLLFVVGTLSVVNVFVAYPMVQAGLSVLLFVAIMLYGAFLLKAQQKYLLDLKKNEKK